jgi:hypothetical protein
VCRTREIRRLCAWPACFAPELQTTTTTTGQGWLTDRIRTFCHGFYYIWIVFIRSKIKAFSDLGHTTYVRIEAIVVIVW